MEKTVNFKITGSNYSVSNIRFRVISGDKITQYKMIKDISFSNKIFKTYMKSVDYFYEKFYDEHRCFKCKKNKFETSQYHCSMAKIKGKIDYEKQK